MRYHYDKPDHYTSMYGQTYICDHPVYSHCTLYKIGEKGLAVIQQRYIPETKSTYCLSARISFSKREKKRSIGYGL